MRPVTGLGHGSGVCQKPLCPRPTHAAPDYESKGLRLSQFPSSPSEVTFWAQFLHLQNE